MTKPNKNQLTPPELETFLAGLHKVHSRDDQHVTEPNIVVHSTDAYCSPPNRPETPHT